MPPLVSILTPSLNQVDFVAFCIESIQRQTHERHEHVIIDGGSTDGTLEIIETHARRDPRITCVVEHDSSQSAALNAALARSSGAIVGWLNTDDCYVATDTLARVVGAFEAHPEAGVVYGDAVIGDERSRVVRHVWTSARQLRRIGEVSPLVQPSIFMRRQVLDDCGFLKEDLHLTMDHELWLRLWRCSGKAFIKVPRVIAMDRNYATRKSRARAAEGRKERQSLAAEYGVPVDTRPRLVRSTSRWLRRLPGVFPLLGFERSYDAAVELYLDPRWRRLIRQLMFTQRRL
jgi:glycosyltransferase involved in cell wall biosynthesis